MRVVENCLLASGKSPNAVDCNSLMSEGQRDSFL